jgi:Cu2+-exporting ATPase
VAFVPWQKKVQARAVQQVTAAGVEGIVGQARYRLGTAEFVSEIFDANTGIPTLPDDENLWLLLGDAQGPVAWFSVMDDVRSDAAALVDLLIKQGIAVELLSGDQSGAVEKLAKQLGIAQWIAGAKPQDKLSHLHAAQQRGDKVLMLGDGINDVPVLSGADISVAMASASDLAQTRADAILLSDNLSLLSEAILLAHRTQQIIKQNLRFSLAYNLLALPLAAAGLVAPWQAAIGMTASSLFVIFNSLRLNKVPQQSQAN